MSAFDVLVSVGIAAILIAAYAGLYLLRQQMQGSQLAMLIDVFVRDAEQNKVGGPQKLAWVLEQIKARYPKADQDLIRSMVEAAVYQINRAIEPRPPAPPDATEPAAQVEWRRGRQAADE